MASKIDSIDWVEAHDGCFRNLSFRKYQINRGCHSGLSSYLVSPRNTVLLTDVERIPTHRPSALKGLASVGTVVVSSVGKEANEATSAVQSGFSWGECDVRDDGQVIRDTTAQQVDPIHIHSPQTWSRRGRLNWGGLEVLRSVKRWLKESPTKAIKRAFDLVCLFVSCSRKCLCLAEW